MVLPWMRQVRSTTHTANNHDNSLQKSVGNLYIADAGNNRIRKVTVSTGIITTLAGTGTAGYTSDNVAATSAALNSQRGVALDASGTSML